MSRFFLEKKQSLLKHKDKLIWFHSFYALLLGIGVMWLGAKDFRIIRWATIQITFIWLSSLAIPYIFSWQKLSDKWKERFRLLINYFNRNFYQQMLFFVLPIYYMSTTFNSPNMFFIVLVAASAVLSTMDIVYDRFISVKAFILSLFFAFNLFACINVMLPILWGFRVVHAVRISALFAFLGFATFIYKLSDISKTKKKIIIAASALMFIFIAEAGRHYIPPAPIKLDKTEFGTSFNRKQFKITSPITSLPTGTKKVYVISHIKAPLKLKEQVKITWLLNAKKIFSSSNYEISGKGEKGGFRLWTCTTLKKIPPDSVLIVEAETEAGQLIGRASLK